VSELVGKSVLIGITCLGPDGSERDRFQAYGVIEEVDEHWIGVRREGLSELFGLPPVQDLFEPAAAGLYTIDATGEQVEDPDYLATLSVTCADLESLLTIRGIGFQPQ
jgi:hypothetical protein